LFAEHLIRPRSPELAEAADLLLVVDLLYAITNPERF